MKLLVVARDCAPDGPGEERLGWNWVRALVRCGHSVHVITSAANRLKIERPEVSPEDDLQLHYLDLSGGARLLARIPGGAHQEACLWHWGAFRLAQKLHAREKFHRVHQIACASCFEPSFLGELGIPFVYGPVRGGESAPGELRRSQRPGWNWREALRHYGDGLIALNPLMRRTFARAQVIVCATAGTLQRIPPAFRAKCIVQPAAAIEEASIAPAPQMEAAGQDFLCVGGLDGGSGLHLAFSALARVRTETPLARLRVLGTAADCASLLACASRAGVAHAVDWIPAAGREELTAAYRKCVALIAPCFDDSGVSVLEALGAGLPVVCLDRSGPGEVTTPDCACVVKTDGLSEEEVVRSMSDAMILLATNELLRARLSANALQRARQFTWDRAARSLSDSVEALIHSA